MPATAKREEEPRVERGAKYGFRVRDGSAEELWLRQKKAEPNRPGPVRQMSAADVHPAAQKVVAGYSVDQNLHLSAEFVKMRVALGKGNDEQQPKS